MSREAKRVLYVFVEPTIELLFKGAYILDIRLSQSKVPRREHWTMRKVSGGTAWRGIRVTV